MLVRNKEKPKYSTLLLNLFSISLVNSFLSIIMLVFPVHTLWAIDVANNLLNTNHSGKDWIINIDTIIAGTHGHFGLLQISEGVFLRLQPSTVTMAPLNAIMYGKALIDENTISVYDELSVAGSAGDSTKNAVISGGGLEGRLKILINNKNDLKVNLTSRGHYEVLFNSSERTGGSGSIHYIKKPDMVSLISPPYQLAGSKRPTFDRTESNDRDGPDDDNQIRDGTSVTIQLQIPTNTPLKPTHLTENLSKTIISSENTRAPPSDINVVFLSPWSAQLRCDTNQIPTDITYQTEISNFSDFNTKSISIMHDTQFGFSNLTPDYVFETFLTYSSKVGRRSDHKIRISSLICRRKLFNNNSVIS